MTSHLPYERQREILIRDLIPPILRKQLSSFLSYAHSKNSFLNFVFNEKCFEWGLLAMEMVREF